MSTSPYSNPNDPYDPNGVAHYVSHIDRQSVKLLYSAWLKAWRDAYRNNTAYPDPFEWDSLYGGGIVYDGTSTYNGTATY